MSLASSTAATSRRNTFRSGVTGMAPRSLGSTTIEFTGTRGICSWTRIAPDGLTAFPAAKARTTSSGDRLYARRRFGSARTTTVRWFPPNGGGADTPGMDANIGRTLKSAWSWICPMVFVSLDRTR